MGINKGLVPLGLGALLYRFSPSFTFITRTKTWRRGIGLAVILTGFVQKNQSVRWTSQCAALDRVGALLISNQYQTCLIFTILRQVASDGRPSEKEQTGRHQQAYAACVNSGHLLQRLYRLLNQESAHALILLSCSSVQNKTQARIVSSSSVFHLIHLFFCWSTVWSHATVESLIQTAGVRSRVLDEFSSVCVFRGLFCWFLGSPTFLGYWSRLDCCVASIIQ